MRTPDPKHSTPALNYTPAASVWVEHDGAEWWLPWPTDVRSSWVSDSRALPPFKKDKCCALLPSFVEKRQTGDLISARNLSDI